MGISAGLLWDLFKHARSWLANLDRAGMARKAQSTRALRDVVTAARETSVYIRQVQETGTSCHATEARLALLWTELGFALQDLGITRLAKRCQISGKHWSDPEHYDEEFLRKADISLERMEKLALQILHQANR